MSIDSNSSADFASRRAVSGPTDITGLSQGVQITVPEGNVVAITVSGAFSGVTLTAQTSTDGLTWVNATVLYNPSSPTSFFSTLGFPTTDTAAAIGGARYFRLFSTAYTSGTATITLALLPSTTPALTNQLSAATGTLPEWSRLSDGTTFPVAVKAASTAAVVSDKALVVAVSPNNVPILPAGAATAVEQGAALSGASGILAQGVISDAQESFLDSTIRPLSLTSQGRLRVSVRASDFDEIWNHTFDNPWNSADELTALPTAGSSDISYAGKSV